MNDITSETATSQVGRGSWTAALKALRAIREEDAAFTPSWWEQSLACSAECKAIPHTTFPPENYTGGRCQTTADPFAVKQARREVAQLDAGTMHLDPAYPDLIAHYEVKRELVKAADARDRTKRSIRDRYDMDRLDNRAEELGDAICEAEQAVMLLPAPDLAALRTKLDIVTDGGKEWAGYSLDYTAQLRADIARLLPKGA